MTSQTQKKWICSLIGSKRPTLNQIWVLVTGLCMNTSANKFLPTCQSWTIKLKIFIKSTNHSSIKRIRECLVFTRWFDEKKHCANFITTIHHKFLVIETIQWLKSWIKSNITKVSSWPKNKSSTKLDSSLTTLMRKYLTPETDCISSPITFSDKNGSQVKSNEWHLKIQVRFSTNISKILYLPSEGMLMESLRLSNFNNKSIFTTS